MPLTTSHNKHHLKSELGPICLLFTRQAYIKQNVY